MDDVTYQSLQLGEATPDNITAVLRMLAAEVPANFAIVELGVYLGKTTIALAQAARDGLGAHVWAIDAWNLPGNTYGPPFTESQTREIAHYNIQACGLADRVTIIHGFSAEQAARWDGPPIGMLLIDADHSYEGALADLRNWAPHLAPEAVIAFDDYGHPDWPGVAQAVDELVDEGTLQAIQLFHNRLATTKLKENP